VISRKESPEGAGDHSDRQHDARRAEDDERPAHGFLGQVDNGKVPPNMTPFKAHAWTM
jgi:hypothetical protein